ncbi:MAG: SprB repeat-containing protein [Bacteroidetes bacterium]|nr:SprB repeat-containing protein [Bacteroidota bacterium]
MKNLFTSIKRKTAVMHLREYEKQNVNTVSSLAERFRTSVINLPEYTRLHKNDVAENAASFAFINPAINHAEKKSFMKKRLQSIKKISVLMFLSLVFVVTAKANNIIISTSTNWSAITGGSGPGGLPSSADFIQIRGGATVTVNVTNAVCGSLKIGGDNANNNTGTLAFATTGNPFLTVSGNVQVGGDGNAIRTGTITFQNGATLNAGSITLGSGLATPAPGTITMTAGGTLNVSGAITVNTVAGNTWTPGTGTVNLSASSTLPTTIFTSFYNLTISNSAVVTFPSAKSITNNLSIVSGSSLNLGTSTHTAGTLTLGGSGTVSGSWGSTSSSATNKNNTYFAATSGIINVTNSTCTPPAAPAVTTPVTYCQGATASALTASGTNLLWYTASTGGTGSSTAPIPSTSTPGSTTYYVSQTIGCESPRAAITVVVNSAPSTSVNGSTNVTCYGGTDGTITIAVTGGTAPYSFSVDNGVTYPQTSSTSPYTFIGLQANTPYQIRVKDNNGCVSQSVQ